MKKPKNNKSWWTSKKS